MASDTSPRVGSHPPENTSDTSERPRDAAFQVRRGPGARPTALPAAVAGVFADYEDEVARPGGPLGADSVRVYRSRVRQYLAWLAAALADGAVEADPLTDPDARDQAVRDYRTHLQTVAKRKPSTINAHLTAVDDFYPRPVLRPAAPDPPPAPTPTPAAPRPTPRPSPPAPPAPPPPACPPPPQPPPCPAPAPTSPPSPTPSATPPKPPAATACPPTKTTRKPSKDSPST